MLHASPFELTPHHADLGEESGGDQQSSKQKVEEENCLKLVGGLSQKQGIRAGVQTPIISI